MPTEFPIIHEVRKKQEQSRMVEELELEFSNGERRLYRRLLAQGEGAVIVVAMPDPAHVLLVREYAAGMERYELGPVKGSIDAGEDVLAAANRELMEEAGFGARQLQVLKPLALSPSYMTHVAQVVLAEDLYEQRLPGDEPEPMEVVRWPLANLGELVARDDISDGRAIAALFIVREWLQRRAK
ncbi:ADP compounds hydrolase NudE [Lysobacteraceae bacterium NML120232]|nr:ADP compounds hydrolase NudE [Xanthomonadaceae bacterium NML08-0793]PJK11899.1 ADP compounds hydrolase NudE [Xanthomonadaceae bacterium NML120232]